MGIYFRPSVKLAQRSFWKHFNTSDPGAEQFVNFSFRSVHFVGMKLQFSSIPYSPTIGHGDCSVRSVEFDEKFHELFRPRSDHQTTLRPVDTAPSVPFMYAQRSTDAIRVRAVLVCVGGGGDGSKCTRITPAPQLPTGDNDVGGTLRGR